MKIVWHCSAAVKETGKDIRQLIAEGHTVPYIAPMITLNEDGTFEGNFKHYQALDEWVADSPLGKYSKVIVIGTKEEIEKYHKINHIQ